MIIKKAAFRLIAALLVCCSLVGSAQSDIVAIEGFTHPEIGEFIIYNLENNQPFFTIYGFVQYKIMDPEKPYRGVVVSGKKKTTGLDASLAAIFNSYAGRADEPVPVVFKYEGILDNYAYLLDTLPEDDKLKAIKIMSGFEGEKAFSSLKKIKGLEDFDPSYLEDSYQEYTIRIGKKDYPYRVLMFYIEEEDWQESYFERYAYIKDGKQWKLIQIAKEYSGEYRQRNKYIHGLAGQSQEDYGAIVHDALRGATWFTLKSELESLESRSVENNELSLPDVSVFRLPADLTYKYNKKNWLSEIEYRLKSSKAFYSAFISLYMRYYDPITVSEGMFTWSLPDTQIELIYDDAAPILRFVPRIDQDKETAG